MQAIAKGELSVARQCRSLLVAGVLVAGCGAAPGEADDSLDGELAGVVEPLKTAPEDGLVDAFDTFASAFGSVDLDGQFRMGYGPHPGLISEEVVGPDGALASGRATLNMNNGNVSATLNNVPTRGNFDLWFVKNISGGTVAPESTDQMLKVGSFSKSGANRTLSVPLGTRVFFDLDLIVVTRAGKKPFESRVAIGDRTLFEKRLFRFRQSQGLDPVTGPLANDIETTDPLVARGAQLFFNETFGGNGRTCGTCHRADESLTISPAFIAALPQSDPLFVAENNPELAQLENTQLLRSRALILENLDGFDDPTNKFVMRSVQHTLSLGLTNGVQNAAFSGQPPDQRLGWSGDGGPGRSTLHEFTFGAIMQHFTKTLARRPGVDFRIPTEEELDALEAFQLFTGRQKPSDFERRLATDARAQAGQGLFFGTGCTICHTDLQGFVDSNLNFDTGVANLTPELPIDDGFSSPGNRTFNVPPLAEAADTAPLFHNNAVDTIEDAVAFYFSPTFQASPSSFFIVNQLSAEQQGDVAAFLRVVNSATNIDEVRKRVQYIKNVRSAGNTDLLNVAIADTRDARTVLSEKALSADVQQQLIDAETHLSAALRAKDRDRPSIMRKVLTLLDKARAALFSDTPPEPDPGSGGGGAASGGGGAIEAGAPSAGTFTSGGNGTAGTAPTPPGGAGP
jgi:cytochrome c peroxidase